MGGYSNRSATKPENTITTFTRIAISNDDSSDEEEEDDDDTSGMPVQASISEPWNERNVSSSKTVVPLADYILNVVCLFSVFHSLL